MWPRKHQIAKADAFAAEAEQRNQHGRQLAQQAVKASRALREQVVENHFTDLLVRAMQRGT